MIPKDKEKRKRYLQALGIAVSLHLAAGLSLGCFDNWISPDTSSKIIEVTLARPGHKKKVEVKKPKPVPIKPRKDDIVDKNLKPVPEENEQAKDDVADDTNTTAADTGSEGPVNDGAEDGVAVQRPYVTFSSKPPYPSEAKSKGIQGTVNLRILINEKGRVDTAEVASSSGNAFLDNAALNNIYKWRFSPAKNGKGKAIPCYVNVPIAFRLK